MWYQEVVVHQAEETDLETDQQTEAILAQAEEEVPDAEAIVQPVEAEKGGTIPGSHTPMKRRKAPDSHPVPCLTRN